MVNQIEDGLVSFNVMFLVTPCTLSTKHAPTCLSPRDVMLDHVFLNLFCMIVRLGFGNVPSTRWRFRSIKVPGFLGEGKPVGIKSRGRVRGFRPSIGSD